MSSKKQNDGSSFFGQARLTRHEMRRVPLGNQNTHRRRKSIVKWQIIKAAAVHYGVSDWTSKIDPSLTYEENVALMRDYATMPGSRSCRDLAAREKAKIRW